MKLKKRNQDTIKLRAPTLGLIAATRGVLGAGIGLLAAGRLPDSSRKAVGWTLLAAGALATLPLAMRVRKGFGYA